MRAAQSPRTSDRQLAIGFRFLLFCVRRNILLAGCRMLSIKMNARPPQTNETAENYEKCAVIMKTTEQRQMARLKLNTSQFHFDAGETSAYVTFVPCGQYIRGTSHR